MVFSIFHFFKALLINEGETTQGEKAIRVKRPGERRESGRNDLGRMGIGAKRLRGRTGFGAKRPGTHLVQSQNIWIP